jgi:hypothetical protein
VAGWPWGQIFFIEIVKMYIKMSFFDIVYDVHKDSQDGVSAGIGI